MKKEKEVTTLEKAYLIAKDFDMEIVSNLRQYRLVQEKMSRIPYLFAKQNLVLPVDEDENKMIVAVCDPLNLEPIEELKLLVGKEISTLFCYRETLEEAIELCYHRKEGEVKQIFSNLEDQKGNLIANRTIEDYDLLEEDVENPVIKMVNAILREAIQQKASDIHFEPQEDKLSIRYRIDGVLQKRHTPSKEHQSQLLTRIKVMAKLDIAEHRLPQDGRIKLKMGGREIDFRVSTIPVVYGERIVLRILDRSNIMVGLNKVGMKAQILEDFSSLIRQREGIILVTGPTGSGKTTTLYSAIAEINSSEMNIMTIEDPVEYKLFSIAQINVNSKINLTFARGLRHILRQDPDAVMIGEIRDRETAEIAIQAALTGHLVLSTLHTNDAPSALTRLADMGIESYLLSSCVIGVVAQRLVRKICPKCKVSYVPTASELALLQIKREELPKGKLKRSKGCAYCYHTGYKGRCGIFELMLISSQIKKRIMKSVDAAEIRKVALSENMISLRSSGNELVKEGITTSSELLRVTDVI